MFMKKAHSIKLFCIPSAYHDLLIENDTTRSATRKIILDFFNQSTDDVTSLEPFYPLVECDRNDSIFTWPELLFRSTGFYFMSL
jgi:hypothetical protein